MIFKNEGSGKEKERNEALETENALLKKEEEKMLKWSLEEERKLVRRVIKELEIEKERTREFEQETSSGGKRRKTTVASGDATIPQLPTDVSTKIAAESSLVGDGVCAQSLSA